MVPITNLDRLQQTQPCNVTCYDSNSTDSEINSTGSCLSDDFTFDIVSQSTESEEEQVCKPLQIHDIISCCSYANENIFITKENIKCIGVTGHRTRYVTCNRKIVKLVSYDGYLYGLDKYGDLYCLSNHYYNTDYWVFTKVEWAPRQIKYICVTLNHQHLWIETVSKCYLYHHDNHKIFNGQGMRVYGKNNHCYLEIAYHTCKVYIDDECIETIKNVKEAVLDCHNDVHVVRSNENRHVAIVNHKPYYY